MIGIDRRAAEPRRDRPPSPRHDPEQDAARNGWSQVAQRGQGRAQKAGDQYGRNTAPEPGEGGGDGRGGRAALAAIGLDLDIDREAQLHREKQRFFERRYRPAGKFRRKPSTGIKAANSGKAVGRDAALSGRRPVEPRVMTQDEYAVAGQPHIELDPAAAELSGAAQTGKRVLGRPRGSAAMADHGSKRRAGRHGAAPRSQMWRQSAACSCAGCSRCRRSPRSSPVCWLTCRMLSLTLPRSSKPRTLTLTRSPTLTTSATLPTRCGANSLIWTRPSREPRKFTKAPKSTVLTTLPV